MRNKTHLVLLIALGLGACTGAPRDKDAYHDLAEDIRALAPEIAEFTKQALARESELFSTPEKVLSLCAAPIEFEPERAPPELKAYLSRIQQDPSIIPKVDCLFVGTGDGSTTLYTFSPVPAQNFFLLREQHWINPKGAIAVGKHPFHLASYAKPSWNLPHRKFDRVALSSQTSTSLRFDTESTLRVVDEDGAERQERFWVDKTFDIRRNGALIDQLHVIVRDYGTVKIFGDDTQVRRWYLFSERANTVVRAAPLPIGFDPLAREAGTRLANTDLRAIAHIRDGRFALIVTPQELAPVRAYLETFDIWH